MIASASRVYPALSQAEPYCAVILTPIDFQQFFAQTLQIALDGDDHEQN